MTLARRAEERLGKLGEPHADGCDAQEQRRDLEQGDDV